MASQRKRSVVDLPEPAQVETTSLRFDANNPRIKELTQELEGTPTQNDILEVLWKSYSAEEIALSIAENGYFEHEMLFAKKENSHYTVLEGNRRLAAVRVLVDDDARRIVGAAGLPHLTARAKKELRELPVIECDRSQIWNYIGFKHVNGPQAWQSFAKAEYIAWVHNTLHIPLDVIARHIGDQHSTVRRLYRALMALEQVEAARGFHRSDRMHRHFSFSHLYTGLDYAGIQKFTGVSGERSFIRRPIPPEKVRQFGELCIWMFGSKSRNLQPIVQSQNPDLRILDEVLNSRDGLAALRRGLPLTVSSAISKGDERLFREAMVGAKQALQEARGRILTGYDGEADLLDTSNDILTLASSINREMQDMQSKKRVKRVQIKN